MYTENFNSFTGTGFAPDPSIGQLDSNIWSITGLSDGDLDFGETATSDDFARGSSTGGVGTGGVYAFEVETGNSILGIQPTGSDSTPGELVLKIANNSDSKITDVNLNYAIYFLNNQARSNSLNLAYSEDGATYKEINALDFATPEASDSLGWQSEERATSISGLNLAPDESLYLKWTGDDVSGSGSRDEYGIDDVVVEDATNFTPTVANFMGDRNTIQGNLFSFTIPEDTFNDADGDELTYTATLADGSNLPGWLSFATDTATFSGTPTSNDIGNITIEVTASDGNGKVSDEFNLLVADIVASDGEEAQGTSGNNGIVGSVGQDTIRGADGDDAVNGGAGDDQLYGDEGNDFLSGSSGDDDLEGGSGNDELDGGDGKDKLYGNVGNDSFSGGANNDFLFGGAGDDLLDGGLGNDNLRGGNGADRFVLRLGDGQDTVQDFSDGIDLFAMAGGLSFGDLSITLVATHPIFGNITQIVSGSETLALVIGVSPNNLTEAEDFTTL